MDRFIDLKNYCLRIDNKYLKSNMDRFIVVNDLSTTVMLLEFKIQYG